MNHPRWRTRRGLLLAAIIALAAAALVTAFVLAVRAPIDRAAPIAGVLTSSAASAAAIFALALSTAALTRTERQLLENRRALALSRFPLVVPLHEATTLPIGGDLGFYPPAESRFRAPRDGAAARLFLRDTPDEYTIAVENVGVGPAIGISGELWCSDGRSGVIRGAAILASAQRAVLTASVAFGRVVPSELNGLLAAGDHLAWYWLELHYRDVFAEAQRASAFFYPKGVGRWEIASGLLATD